MLSQFIIFLLLLAFWLLLSGHYDGLLLALGIVSAGLVTWLCRRLGIIGTRQHTFRFYLRLPAYALWLTGLIIASNVRVAMIILSPKLRINPGFCRVPTSQRTDLGRLVRANSITLTPGTISTDVIGDTIEVHVLSRQPDDDAKQRVFDQRTRRLETGT